jgi:uncharacterized membrane protein
VIARLARALRGFRGHPAHPALTDVTVGAWTVVAAASAAGLLGFAERRMADAAFVAAVVTLVSTLLTIPTGAVDYARIERGTPLRRTASLHWVIQIWATTVLLVATALLDPGPRSTAMPSIGGWLAVGSWLVMVFGSWVGGALVTVHGMRVLNEPDMPTGQAIKPKYPPD